MRPLAERLEDRLYLGGESATDRNDILVLSDYGKGVFSDRALRELIEHEAKAGKKIIGRSRAARSRGLSGRFDFTPNRAELTLATGLNCETDEDAEDAARRAHLACDTYILLTRADKGMSLFPREGAPTHIPTVAREVFDVSGAGDTVVAVRATSLAAGGDMLSAMRVANSRCRNRGR